MARFLGRLRGDAGKTQERLGQRTFHVEVNGWNGGVVVEAHRGEGEQDVFYVYATHGTSGDQRRLIAQVVGREGQDPQVIAVGPVNGSQPEVA